MQKWRCTVCVYETESDTKPESCPVCGAPMALVEEEGTEASETETADCWRCEVCQYLHDGDAPPESCPVCQAPSGRFVPHERKGTAPVEEEAGEAQETEAAEETAPKTGTIPEPPPTGLMDTLGPVLEVLDEQVHKHHLHPISVHMPNGVIPIAFFFAAIGWIFGSSGFEMAAHYNLTMVFLALPLVIYSGYVVWRDRYKKALTKPFKIKLGAAAVVAIAVSTLVLWKSIDPAAGGPVFMLLYLVAVGATAVAGHYGGKFVFGTRKPFKK